SIHGVPKTTPPDSLHTRQNMKSYFACLLTILSELSVLRHNLYSRYSRNNSFQISPNFTKI
ncbi:MAG: hypothetical protein VB121_07200, partial [Enterococcus thailandicus]|nr:hypothetical protein [Enterococcus thailandicus]